METHAASDEAVHWQSRAASTFIVALPPLDPKERAPALRLGAHRTADGPTTSVSAVVPPQPYTAARITTTMPPMGAGETLENLVSDMSATLLRPPLMHFPFH